MVFLVGSRESFFVSQNLQYTNESLPFINWDAVAVTPIIPHKSSEQARCIGPRAKEKVDSIRRCTRPMCIKRRDIIRKTKTTKRMLEDDVGTHLDPPTWKISPAAS